MEMVQNLLWMTSIRTYADENPSESRWLQIILHDNNFCSKMIAQKKEPVKPEPEVPTPPPEIKPIPPQKEPEIKPDIQPMPKPDRELPEEPEITPLG